MLSFTQYTQRFQEAPSEVDEMMGNSSSSNFSISSDPSMPMHTSLRCSDSLRITYSNKNDCCLLSSCRPCLNRCSDILRKAQTTKKKRRSRNNPLAFAAILATSFGTLSITSAFQTISIRRIPHPTRTKWYVRSTPTEEIVEAVIPLTSSSKEKRLSVERAWEQARVLAMNDASPLVDRSASETPYLDLFTEAIGHTRSNDSQGGNNNEHHVRPRGRPDSVPGAMSRTTLLSINELEAYRSSESYVKSPKIEAVNYLSSLPVKRGRGRPRKNQDLDASVDEITSIAATSSVSNLNDDDVSKELFKTEPEDFNSSFETGQRKSRVKLNLPKARKMTDNEKAGETTGMMQTVGRGRRLDDPPSIQRYYHTQLLTQQEEYMLGMKIQLLMKCEQVHEGLYETIGRIPSIAEWANACGFKEIDSVRLNPDYIETELETSLRPSKSEAWGEDSDPTMFVGNGLANDTGPGRGRGRAKKGPLLSLKDYYDDSELKFHSEDAKKRKKDLAPINQGTVEDFLDVLLVGKEAKQRMVQCNMRLVVSISKRYKHVGVSISDLVQEGSIGLTRAAEKFDPKKGFKFSTYASWWIQQAVFRAIAYHSRTIRLPVHVHNLLNRVRRISGELKRLHGRAPTNEEMAAELDVPVEKFVKMLRLTRKVISLDKSKYQNNPKDIGQESLTSLGDTIDAADVVRDENTPEQTVDRDLFRDDLNEMLDVLGEDEKRVIMLRYGIEDGLTRTVTTVASIMGESKSWVRSQECRALRKLRRPWYEKRLWEHQNSLRG